ncbi:hypothetical protein DPMN_030210 [Dreissena polymorpha]|uniref:Uncharacterized protein n=1 Tax=Dreissena polymorpha TaxID=45954 RepID=A0A9D4LZI2_DREPO|nr:hypothetical protein DPMN_030210 [Dreissena polymorpha]
MKNEKRTKHYLLSGDSLHFLNELRLLVLREEVRHISRVEDHTYVLHERLVLDLGVSKQEHSRLALTASLQEQLSNKCWEKFCLVFR